MAGHRDEDGGDGTELWHSVPAVVRAAWSASPLLTLLAYGTSAVQGLLLPTFALATGALVADLRAQRPTTTAALVAVALFTLQRALDPVAEQLGGALVRRVDEVLVLRVMTAMGDPAGLAHIEDADVHDVVAHVQGEVTGNTAGQAALALTYLIKDRLRGVGALAIVARWSPLGALVLLAAYLLSLRTSRNHWQHVTVVILGRVERLRRAYELRRLALSGDVAKEVRVFGLSGWLVEQYRLGWLEQMRDVWATRDEAWLRVFGCAALVGVVEATVLVTAARQAVAGTLALGTTVAVAQALVASSSLGVYNEKSWNLAEGARALHALRALEAVGARTDGVVSGTAPAATLPQRAVALEGVSFTYPGRTTPVFRDLDLTIDAGTSLAVVGANGAGKSTLIKLLTRMYDPDGGRITVDGTDLRDLDLDAWRRRIAAVFQDHMQLEMAARDNVAVGAVETTATDADLDAVAALAGADVLVGRLSDGWSTPLTRMQVDGTQLSGGEWQRLALARAMLAVREGAGVLVLDEPTAAMDVRGEAEIYDCFLQLTAGLTTIVVSHRFSTVRRADRIVVVEHGRVVEDGSHDELVALGGTYAHMYALQAARFVEDAALPLEEELS